MPVKNSEPLQVLRPAILPDDNVFYWVLAVEIIAVLVGMAFHNRGVALVALMFMGVLPGMPLFFHTVFHLSVKIEIFDDRFVITSYAGDNFVRFAHKQEMSFRDIAYVYYLEREIGALKSFCGHFRGVKDLKAEADFSFDSLAKKYSVTREDYDKSLARVRNSLSDIDPECVSAFLKTKLNLKKYVWTETRAKGYIGTSRVRAYLVFSSKDGMKKAYLANFYDLSGTDSRGFLRTLKEKNPRINFLMNTNQVRRLFLS